jgi:cell division protein FtsL
MASPARSSAPAAPQAPPHKRPADRPDLRVVAPRRHPGVYLLVIAAVTVLGVVGIVSLNALAAESSFAARELTTEANELERRYDELTAEVASLRAPARIRRVAEADLGMIMAEQPAFLVAEAPTADAHLDVLLHGHIADRVKPTRHR